MRRLKATLRRVQAASAPAYCILKYALLTCLALFTGALCVLVWAGEYSLQTLYFYLLARSMADQCVSILLIAVIGSVLVEERLTQ